MEAHPGEHRRTRDRERGHHRRNRGNRRCWVEVVLNTDSGLGGVVKRFMAPPKLLYVYVSGLALCGLVALVVAVWQTPWSQIPSSTAFWPLAVLCLAAVIGELRPVVITRDSEEFSLSTSTPFVVALMAVGGGGIAIVAQLFASLVDDINLRRSPLKSAFNSAQYVLSVLAGRVVFAAITGDPVFAAPQDVEQGDVPAILIAGATMIAVNWIFIAGVVALATGTRLDRILAEERNHFVTSLAVLLSVGTIAAFIAGDGVAPLLFLTMPVVAMHLFTQSAARHAYAATHDQLTGLGNRGQLHRDLDRSLAAALEEGVSGPGLILLDLDHFKDINDTLGHPVGDKVLQNVAQRLQQSIPEDASVHRLGGDEFAVVHQGDVVASQALARDLLESLSEPVPVDGLELLIRASAGLAVAPDHGDDTSELMKNADIALYHAKLERDRISVFSPELDVNSVERLRLLADLRAAIETRALYLEYQPQFDLATGKVVGVEALVRWNHEEHGLIRADDFIPLAENSGLIFPLTTFVFDEAFSQLARWRERGHKIRLAVNVSARHLSDLALPDQVATAAIAHGLPMSCLVLEVTETAILSDPARADVVLRTLRSRGVEISIDDYGTGHASLSYLKRLRIDELKVDRSFVSTIHTDSHDLIIVRSTIALALDLGLRVVAEGIEDQQTADALQGFGKVIGQGFHLARPMSAASIDALLEPTAQGQRDSRDSDKKRTT